MHVNKLKKCESLISKGNAFLSSSNCKLFIQKYPICIVKKRTLLEYIHDSIFPLGSVRNESHLKHIRATKKCIWEKKVLNREFDLMRFACLEAAADDRFRHTFMVFDA